MSASALTLKASAVYRGPDRRRPPMSQASESSVRSSTPEQSRVAPAKSKLSRAEPSRIVDFLQRRYPIKTAESVAAETGIPAGTVKKWLERKSHPSVAAFIDLVVVYGPALLAAAAGNPPEWLTQAARAERQAAIEAEQARLSDELERLMRQA